VVYLGQNCLSDAEATSKAALVVGRELGNLYLEWAALLTLGGVSERLGRAEEAQTHLEAAVRLAHALGDPSSESQSLGSLGLLHARHGRHGEARDALESAEALLREEPYLPRMGLLVVSRAEAQYLAGDAAAATASLAAASAIATQVGAGPSSEIGLELARVSTLMASART
jgi:tetratricopeptide (TPR) repeat protein